MSLVVLLALTASVVAAALIVAWPQPLPVVRDQELDWRRHVGAMLGLDERLEVREYDAALQHWMQGLRTRDEVDAIRRRAEVERLLLRDRRMDAVGAVVNWKRRKA